MLSIDEQAQMLHNFFNYAKGEEPVLNTSGLKLVWAGMKFLLEQDHKNYCDAVGRAHGTKKNKPVPQNKSMVPQNNTMVPYDNVNVNVNVNDNENVDENDRVTAETAVDKFNRLMNQ